MKFFCTTLLLFFSLISFAQKDSVQLSKIRAEVQRINIEDSTYKTKTLENEEFMSHMTDGGGALTGYYRNGELVKIVEWLGLSSCIEIREYFLSDGKLIFVYVTGKEFEYVDSISKFNYDKINLTLEARYYFHDSRLIKFTYKGRTRCNGEPMAEESKAYLEDCRKYVQSLSKKQ